MKKSKRYRDIKFDAKAISAADSALASIASTEREYSDLSVHSDGAAWSYDSFEEFLAAADNGRVTLLITSRDSKMCLEMLESRHTNDVETSVTVEAPKREQIEQVFSVFDNAAERCCLPNQARQEETGEEGRIFIGHGRSPQWKELKDHLQDKHRYTVEAYEIGSRSGHTIKDSLEEMLKASSVALLVMTGEDETNEGKLRARENVVHETGLFQGRLGFSRAVVLLEQGTEEFSNIHGIEQIRFAKGNIKEAFGDVLAFLEREIG